MILRSNSAPAAALGALFYTRPNSSARRTIGAAPIDGQHGVA